MVLLIHILIAFASLIFSSYVFFTPSKTKMRFSYSLAGATLASGLYLVVASPAHLLQACLSGIVYFGVVSFLTVSARRKLALQQG